jgi:hypothetical protein
MRVAASLLVLLSASPASAQATFTWLELLPGVEERSEATGISANGCVVVGTVGSPASGEEAVRWVGARVERIEPVRSGGPFVRPAATSADGAVVAGGVDRIGASALVNDHGVSVEVAAPPNAGTWSIALSDDGRALVAGRIDGSPLLYRRGAYTSLGFSPQGLSADGSVLVGSSPAPSRAIRWQGGVSTELGVLPGEASSHATAVTPDGAVVVGTSGARAFRWQGGVMADLGAGYPRDLSADGDTIVGSGVWSAATGWRSLAEALAEWGLDVSGLALTSATGISDDGLAIVGQGIDPQGRTRAWLALREARDCPATPPPEPPPPAPLPARQALLWVGDLPAPLEWVYPHGFAVAPDGVVYLGGMLSIEEGSEIRLTDGVLEIPAGGPIRILTEDATSWHDPVGADRESVVWSEAGSRIVRVDRRDGAELLDLDLARLGPGSVDSVVLDPDGNAWATTEGVGSDGKPSCFGVVLVTRHGYPERLTSATGDPCFLPEPASAEWHLGALHLWSLAALRRMEGNGTLATVVSTADGLATVGPHDVDAAGNRYVSEFLGDAVWKIDPEGERTRIIDRDGDLVGHPLEQVYRVRVDHRGHVFVSGAYEPSVFEIFPNGAIRRALDETGDGEVPADFGVSDLELDATGNLYALTESALFGVPPSTDVPEPAEPDRDGDGLLDVADDCPLYPNADQRDVDGDGYGNACDPDFNNDGLVGAADLARLGQVFGSAVGDGRYDPVVDMDGNGVIGTYELSVLSGALGDPPGLLRP